ncbi:MAG: hypothetical protein JHC31_14355 [Sulfurihydrogenibium sp.]|jgi:hypothetical protein|nr:hypothetical protein [Sulfurihydrogenibium sp.]
MDIKSLAQNTFEEAVGVGTDLVDFAVNGANFIYHKATGKVLNQAPFSAKVWLNDKTSDYAHFKVFHNIPTTKELKDPNKAKEYVLKAVRNNDNELLQTTFAYSLQNPQSAKTVIHTVKEDFKNRIDTTLKGKSTPTDNIIAVREYNLLKSLIQANPELKTQLPEVVNLDNNLNNTDKVKTNPQLRMLKETIEHYETVNKYIDIANGASVLLFGAGKGLKVVAKTPIAKVVANAVLGVSSATPLVGGLYKADVNKESIAHTLSPLDLYIGSDVVKSVKEIPKTAKTIHSYEMAEKLKSKDFNPTEHLLEHYSKNNKINKTEIEQFKTDLLNAEEVVNKSLKDKIAYGLNTFSNTVSKGLGERANVILNKILSIKNSEEELLKTDRAIVEAFLNHEPVKELITKLFTKEDGKIVIDDVGKLEEELFKLAKDDNLVANYVMYDRQKNLLAEIHNAIEHGNSEIVIGKFKSDTVKVDESNRIQPPIENHIIDLKNNSLKDIIDIAEEEFKKGNVITIGYKTKEGKLITKTLKPINHPTLTDYRVLKGSFHALEDGEWKEIEDNIVIPVSRTHEVREVLKEYAKSKGYEDIKINNATYYKPSRNIITSKVESVAKEVLNTEEKLSSGGKIDNKDFERLVKTAYENGFLHKAVETENGVLDIEMEHYLKSNPLEVINAIKHNLTQHLKTVATRDKEFGEVAEHYVLDKDSDVVKLLSNRLQQLEDFSKHYSTKTLNKEIVELRDLLGRFKTIEEVGYRVNNLYEAVDSIATKMNTTSELLNGADKTEFNVFDNYENFKNFATLKYLTPTFNNLKAIPTLQKFLETLEDLERSNPNRLNETQKLVKKYLEIVLDKNNTPLVKFQRALGNLLTLLNPAVALGNFVATFQTLHLLFPSLDIAKISEVGNAWNKEMKKLIYGDGVYKYNFLNPTSSFTEGVVKAHLLANFKNEEKFEKVIEDYCRNLGITSTEFINEMKAFYKDRKEEFAEDIVNFISGLDGRVLQTFAVKGAKIGENIMPWYKFISSPLSVATQIIKNWKEAPDYIARYGIGKTIGKAVGFTTFSAIALGSQAVPFLAPAETGYTIISQFGNLIANILGEEDIFTDKNFSQFVLKELDYRYLKTGLLDPNEKVNFYNSFGTALLQAIAGAEAVGWDTNPFVHYLRVGLDIISKLGSSGIISPTAGSYVADIPAPSLSLIQNIVKKTMYSNDETTKTTATLIALAQSVPMINNIYKEIAGRVLVKGVGATGKEEIWQPSIPEELLTKESQGLLGIAHLIGFIALHGDTIFNGGMMQKVYQLMRYELATDEEKKNLFSPVRNPAGVERYIGLNFKDIKVFADNNPDEIIATLQYIPENKLQNVRERAVDLMAKNYEEITKLLKKENYSDKDVKEIKHRFNAIQNFLIVSDYLGWYNEENFNKLQAIHNQLYKVLQSKNFDIEYKDILRIKRKLQESK